jgi:4-alpha-glucanotransferase
MGNRDLGPTAYQFVDFLKAAGQSWWQMLPLGPTGYGNSPYMCFSAFAGNPLLISPAKLLEDGFVSPEDVKRSPSFSVERLDYRRVSEHKRVIFEKSYKQFKTNSPAEHRHAFSLFREKHASWLEDFSLFYGFERNPSGTRVDSTGKGVDHLRSSSLQTCSRPLRGEGGLSSISSVSLFLSIGRPAAVLSR